MTVSLFIVDAFVTNTLFSGNPAGVCLLDTWKPDAWMQHIAAEIKHSETAFVVQEQSMFSIRYFTPTTEVPLCGHASLAAAFVLYQQQLVSANDTLVFDAKGGSLPVTQQNDVLTLFCPFPSIETSAHHDDCSFALLRLSPVQSYYVDKACILVMDSEKAVIDYQPDYHAIQTIPYDILILTAQATKPCRDFVSRVFAPKLGINEDPATGIAHCLLAPIWNSILKQDSFHAYQASPRGGEFDISLSNNQVVLTGRCRLVLQGMLCV